MAHTFGKNSARTSSSSNPITTASFTVVNGETVLVLMLKINGSTSRAGGAPSFAGVAMTQASTEQKAASTPEVIAEMWYLLRPEIGAYTCTIPNTGGLTIFYTLATGKATPGARSYLDVLSGANNTSTDPAPGSVTTTQGGDIGFAVCAGGHTDFTGSTATQTMIAETDDGTTGGGEQYHLQATAAAVNLSWTSTSDDWGAIAVYFKESAPVNFQNYMSIEGGDGISRYGANTLMPVIVSTEVIPDGGGGLRITLTSGEVVQVTNSDLPGNIRNGTAQQKEDFCNNFLANKLDNLNYSFDAQVHVFTASPLVVTLICVDLGQTIPPNWWQLDN